VVGEDCGGADEVGWDAESVDFDSSRGNPTVASLQRNQNQSQNPHFLRKRGARNGVPNHFLGRFSFPPVLIPPHFSLCVLSPMLGTWKLSLQDLVSGRARSITLDSSLLLGLDVRLTRCLRCRWSRCSSGSRSIARPRAVLLGKPNSLHPEDPLMLAQESGERGAVAELGASLHLDTEQVAGY